MTGVATQIYTKIFLAIFPPIIIVIFDYSSNRTIPVNKKFKSSWEDFNNYSRHVSKNYIYIAIHKVLHVRMSFSFLLFQSKLYLEEIYL